MAKIIPLIFEESGKPTAMKLKTTGKALPMTAAVGAMIAAL